ncbi:hypothetical protein [Oligoflexus tunisiensis]|uniref:hypothetical protein n=1 Tax=Oligoflexus tunisiensis TaxID=708132 RepID=UPI00114CCA53|nr:hypothetical protein [Oligoflexus tunisiensis]
MKFVSTVLGALLLPFSSAMADLQPPRQEPLLGLRVSSKGITYFVYTAGCTQKSDFEVYTLESYPPQLNLVRIKPDTCDAYVPDGKAIFYRWEEVGLPRGFPFKVNNPVQNFVVPD